jgi:predicted porin
MKAVEQSANPEDDDAYGVSLDYANGPLSVGAVYQVLQDNAEDQEEWSIGAGYDFGMVKVLGSYQAVDGLGFTKGAEGALWQVGVVVPVGAAGNVHLAYGEFDRDDLNDRGAESYSLAYTHALSKRTTAYVAYNNTENESGTNAFGVVDGSAGDLGDDSDIFAVGIRHTF